jgi:hypothetical protein
MDHRGNLRAANESDLVALNASVASSDGWMNANGSTAPHEAAMKAALAGDSGTPLPAKLGIKAGMRFFALDAPPNLDALLAGAPDVVHLNRVADLDFALAFAKTARAAAAAFGKLEPKMADSGMIWIAWPKKSSGVPTDLTEDVVRRAGLAANLVDVKVCAIDATWSGLKFVRRRADRTAAR